MPADPLSFNKNIGPYVGSETVDISTADHTFSAKPAARGLIITASGNVTVTFMDGTSQTIPVVVASSDYILLDGNGKGMLIKTVVKATTTATVLCGVY